MPFYIDDIQTDSNTASLAARDPKESVRVATTANLGSLSGPQTIDGISVIAGNRVLVKDQNTGSANGLYLCAAGAWTRTLDSDTSEKVTCGCRVYVEEGTVNAKTQWVLTTINPIALGSTALVFALDTVAGTGLTRTQNSLAVAYGTSATTACVGNDARLSDGRTDSGAIHKATSAEISALTEKVTPVAADLLIIEDSAASNAKKKIQLGSLPTGVATITYSSATATGTTTTTSSSDGLMNSMTLTPGAGTYLAMFSSSISHSNPDSIYVSLYGNSVQVAASERRVTNADLKLSGSVFPVATQAMITVAAAQAIEVKWRTPGATATAYQRTLTLIKVG